MKKTESTKDLLITSAGELFAEFGFEAVSTRMISDKAEVKLSAIHYHFGSKENLYIETCLTAHSRGKTTNFGDVYDENPNLMKTPEGQAEIVRTTVFRNFHDHFRPDRPEWETKIIVRELAAPSSAMRALVEKIFRPDAESSALFYKQVKPHATDIEAAAWSDLMYGEILLYSMARETIEMVRGANCMNKDYIQTAAAKLARAMILEAGLPLPVDLL
jgi:AcrR family transcriptional regulator